VKLFLETPFAPEAVLAFSRIQIPSLDYLGSSNLKVCRFLQRPRRLNVDVLDHDALRQASRFGFEDVGRRMVMTFRGTAHHRREWAVY